MLRGTLCVLFGSLILFGCTGAIKLQPLPADHPANPAAAEAPMPPPTQTLRDGPEASSEGPDALPSEHPMDHDHEGAVYTCSMHPEVKMSAPGRCPECGMALKQREEK